MLLSAAISLYLDAKAVENRASKTLTGYRQQLNLFCASLPPATELADITTVHCAAFLAAERGRNLSPYTIAARYRCLRAFFNWAGESLHIPSPLTIKPPHIPKKPPRRAATSDIDRLLASIPGATWLDLRDRALLRVLASTGIRVSECAGLRVQDIDLAARLLFVEDGKGSAARYVPFDQRTGLALTAYLYARPAWSAPGLWLAAVNRWGKPEGILTDTGIRQLLRRRCRAAGLPVLNPHSFRHQFATKALNDGVPLSAVSTMLGHSSTDFTARVYAKWLTEGLRAVYDQHWK